MLTKLIITLIVSYVVWTYWRRQSQPQQEQQQLSDTPLLTPQRLLQRYGMLAVFGAVLGVGLLFAGWHLYDDYQIVKVTVSTPISGEQQSYFVRKKDLDVNEFITIDGLHIKLSNQDKIVIDTQAE